MQKVLFAGEALKLLKHLKAKSSRILFSAITGSLQ